MQPPTFKTVVLEQASTRETLFLNIAPPLNNFILGQEDVDTDEFDPTVAARILSLSRPGLEK